MSIEERDKHQEEIDSLYKKLEMVKAWGDERLDGGAKFLLMGMIKGNIANLRALKNLVRYSKSQQIMIDTMAIPSQVEVNPKAVLAADVYPRDAEGKIIGRAD